MKALHIHSTAPLRWRSPEAKTLELPGFEIVMFALSALLWKKHNGPIKFYTDDLGYDFFDKAGIIGVWDEVDVDVLNNIPWNINHDTFWAASKLFAMKAEDAPMVQIDTDLLVWKNIDDKLADCEVAAFHPESLGEECYLEPELLKIRPGYKFKKEWDWTALPSNTALAYFKDKSFFDYYFSHAIDFMTDNMEPAMENVSQMVFAEQRMLAMCAAEKGKTIRYLLKYPNQEDNDTFTHIWGAKTGMRSNTSECETVTKAMLSKLKELSPEWHERLIALEAVRKDANL